MFGKGCDGVGCSEEWVRGFVVDGCVPFYWSVFLPVTRGCFYDAVADVCGRFFLVLSGVVYI